MAAWLHVMPIRRKNHRISKTHQLETHTSHTRILITYVLTAFLAYVLTENYPSIVRTDRTFTYISLNN